MSRAFLVKYSTLAIAYWICVSLFLICHIFWEFSFVCKLLMMMITFSFYCCRLKTSPVEEKSKFTEEIMESGGFGLTGYWTWWSRGIQAADLWHKRFPVVQWLTLYVLQNGALVNRDNRGLWTGLLSLCQHQCHLHLDPPLLLTWPSQNSLSCQVMLVIGGS